jgi:hypothetical protein
LTSISLPRRRLLALALVVGAGLSYLAAAWRVPPGFFDGLAPPEPYRWTSPPPQLRSGNQPPLPGHLEVKVNRGVSDPGSVFTNDGQFVLSFIPGSFTTTPDQGSVSLRVVPETTYPDPEQLRFATNVYLVTSSAPLNREATVTLRFSDQIPAPSDIYFAPASGGGWKDIGATGSSAPFTVSQRTPALGYFAAGYPPAGAPTPPPPRVGGSQTLPIVIAVVIVLAILATFPLALMRRRSSTGGGSAARPGGRERRLDQTEEGSEARRRGRERPRRRPRRRR